MGRSGRQPKLAYKPCGGGRLAPASQLTSNLQFENWSSMPLHKCPNVTRSCIVCPRMDPLQKRGALPHSRGRRKYFPIGDAVELTFLSEAGVPISWQLSAHWHQGDATMNLISTLISCKLCPLNYLRSDCPCLA